MSLNPTPLKRLYPADRGWIRARLTFVASGELTEKDIQEIKNMCSGCKPENYEFPVVTKTVRTVSVIYRKLPEIAAAEEQALLYPLCRGASLLCFEVGSAEVCWHKGAVNTPDDNHYVFEAWRCGLKLGSVKINSLHVHMDTQDIIQASFAELLQQVETRSLDTDPEPLINHPDAAPTDAP